MTLGGWNEYRSVATAKAIALGRDHVVEVPCSPIDPLHRRDLIHLTCPLTGQKILGAGFAGLGEGVSGLQLKSEVQVYQWVLETVKTGGSNKDQQKTVKEWHKKWKDGYEPGTGPHTSTNLPPDDPHDVDELVNPPLTTQPWWDSRLRFGHFTIDTATDIKVGAFAFPAPLLSSVLTERTLSPNCSAPSSCPRGVSAMGNTLYFKYDPESAVHTERVGDMRQTFWLGDAHFASVLAQQSVGESLVPWPSPYDPSYTIFLATGQDATAEEMFAKAESDNVALTWVLRLVTWLCTSGGIFLLLSPLGMLVAWVPCLGGVLEGLVDMVVCGFSCAVGSMCWFMVAGFVWVFYRPYIGVPLLLVSGGLFVWLVFFRSKGMWRRPMDLEGRPGPYNPEAALDEDQLMPQDKPEEPSAPPEPMNFCAECGARKPVSMGMVCRACAAQG